MAAAIPPILAEHPQFNHHPFPNKKKKTVDVVFPPNILQIKLTRRPTHVSCQRSYTTTSTIPTRYNVYATGFPAQSPPPSKPHPKHPSKTTTARDWKNRDFPSLHKMRPQKRQGASSPLFSHNSYLAILNIAIFSKIQFSSPPSNGRTSTNTTTTANAMFLRILFERIKIY